MVGGNCWHFPPFVGVDGAVSPFIKENVKIATTRIL
jgi:hypothetical protein